MQKTIGTILFCLAMQSIVIAKSPIDSIKTALLIVDIQNFYFPGEGPGLENVEDASLVAKEILGIFRENNQTVVHVRHKAAKGFDIHKNVEPLPHEKVITKQEVNSFNNTDLLEYLESNRITRLVIVGMQTHMCLEAATRAAYDYGFQCVVVHNACATRDVNFGGRIIKAEDVHANTLATIAGGGYGKVIDSTDFKERMRMYLFNKID